MKLLVDMNLSPRWVGMLTSAGRTRLRVLPLFR
jgi:predicted nuclease of predicted toxin-antitoxin system